MKFKKISISLLIIVCLIKISTCQLFEQFNDEPVALEKKTKSLFEEPEKNIKPINSIFSDNKTEKKTNNNNNNNAVPSIFGAVDNNKIKPIMTPKPQQIDKLFNNQVNKNAKMNNIENNISPIKKLPNQENKLGAKINKKNNLCK